MNVFDSVNINLSGKNLIEASAGTGKTYSVTIMALRLIIEEGIDVNQILMVTFTEAATAEMADRLRKFVREAYNYAKDARDCDDPIKKVIDEKGIDKNLVLSRLQNAVKHLDDINVFTIHGFCQRTLTEFAFETGQSFGLDVITNDNDLISEVVTDYWRTECTILDSSERELVTTDILQADVSAALSSPDLSLEPEPAKSLAEKVLALKQKRFLLSYDDMIKSLFVVAENGDNKNRLIDCLKKKYKAVFIDEFQDTDKYQFTIFAELFPDIPQFYIGDPKQSIYSFRGADLDSYLNVVNQGVAKFEMTQNFRSSNAVIDDLNLFYDCQTDPFQNPHINYVNVSAHGDKTAVTINGETPGALSILIGKFTKDVVYNSILARVITYLNCGQITELNRSVVPSDIAILVRTNSKAKDIKGLLVANGIPAITLDDTNVLSTDEAKFVCNLVVLLNNPSRSQLIIVLTDKYIGKTCTEIEKIDYSVELEKIKEMKSLVPVEGIYSILHKILSLYHNEIEAKLRYGNDYNRSKSNILQLIDLVHQKVNYDNMSPDDIPVWMKREVQSPTGSGEQYEQKLESDENAVKVMTVHKSKGLEFNIVIMTTFPMYLGLHNRLKFCPEDLRLLYVGLTRGKYKVDLISTTDGRSGLDGFINLLNDLKRNAKSKKLYDSGTWESSDITYIDKDSDKKRIFNKASAQKIDNTWQLTNYSSLANHVEFLPDNIEVDLLGYDDFVFKQMPKGQELGIFIHSLFENANFEDRDYLDYLQNFKSKGSLFLKKDNLSHYNNFIQNVLNADLNGFKLSRVSCDKRLNEFEYHFSLNNKFSVSKINEIIGRKAVANTFDLQGVLKGFMDMVFEHNGKYYILDWKSNYLGNTIEAYSTKNMKEAMEASSYDLQYLIYSVALCRFLKQRIPNFDIDQHFGGGFWLFVRGCRSNQKSGVYYQPVNKKMIEELGEVFG